MGSYKKKLFIALLLILLIGFFVCGSVNGATTYNYTLDTLNTAQSYQDRLSYIFIKNMEKNVNSNVKPNFINDLKNNQYFQILRYNATNNKITVYFYAQNINWGNLNEFEHTDIQFNDYFLDNPVSGYNVNGSDMGGSYIYYSLDLSNGQITRSTASATVFFIPTLLIGYRNAYFGSYMNGITPADDVYIMIMQSIQDNTDQEEETTNELKKLNDFMKSDDVDDDAYDMPGNSDNPTQDITEAGVDNIFNIFYDAIDNWNSRDILVTIPFANKIFWIDADLTENIVDNFFPSGIFKNLLGLVWYYLLAVYIIKDVQKYIDGLQTGEILTKSDTNIKTEML